MSGSRDLELLALAFVMYELAKRAAIRRIVERARRLIE